MIQRILLALCIFLSSDTPGFPGEARDDLDLLKQRYVAACLAGAPEPRSRIEALRGSLSENGRWEDVDYEDQRRSAWKTFEHLDRTLRLARALRDPEHPLFENPELSRATHSALDAWLEARFVNPNWWWNRIPGTTIEQKPLEGTPRHRGETDFVGGVSDGTHGVAAMDFRSGELTARKSWFFFDEGYLCLGAGIACPSEHPVLTSIEQRHLQGEVAITVRDAASARAVTITEIVEGRWTLRDTLSVLHDGVGYAFLEPVTVITKCGAQQGSWHRINNRYPETEESLDTFGLWLDHGASPAGASYAYLVLPGVDQPRLEEHRAAPSVTMLRNEAGLQAAWHEELGILGAAFYEPGSLESGDGHRWSVDQPCLLLARPTADGLQLAVSDPRQEALAVVLTIDAELGGDGAEPGETPGSSRVAVDLPVGERAGASVVRTFSVRPAPTPAEGGGR